MSPSELKQLWELQRDRFVIRAASAASANFDIAKSALVYRQMKLGGDLFLADCKDAWQRSGELWESALQDFYKLMPHPDAPPKEPAK